MNAVYHAVPPTGIDSHLGWQASSIRCDNPGPCYWYIPDAGQWVLPHSYGKMVIIPSPTERAFVQFSAPIGIPQPIPAPGTVSPTTFTFYDESYSVAASEGINAPAAAGKAPLALTFQSPVMSVAFTPSVPIVDGFDLFIQADNAIRIQQLCQFKIWYAIPPNLLNPATGVSITGYLDRLLVLNDWRVHIAGYFPPQTEFLIISNVNPGKVYMLVSY